MSTSRRGFLSGLLTGAVAAPAVAKAVTEQAPVPAPYAQIPAKTVTYENPTWGEATCSAIDWTVTSYDDPGWVERAQASAMSAVPVPSFKIALIDPRKP